MVASERELSENLLADAERDDIRSSRKQVRECVTTSSGGEVERHLVVLCRDRGAVIPIEECADCPRCDGWVLDPNHAESFVVCHPECDMETEPDGEPVDTGPG